MTKAVFIAGAVSPASAEQPLQQTLAKQDDKIDASRKCCEVESLCWGTFLALDDVWSCGWAKQALTSL
jgi:hypothetical protein